MKRININGKWTKVDLKKENDFYIIIRKNKAKKSDTVDPTTIQKVRFEIAIDSGVKNGPLTVNYINMNFNDITSSDIEVNKITAMMKYINFPSEFYIRAIEFYDGKTTIKEGKSSISVTINAQKLN